MFSHKNNVVGFRKRWVAFGFKRDGLLDDSPVCGTKISNQAGNENGLGRSQWPLAILYVPN